MRLQSALWACTFLRALPLERQVRSHRETACGPLLDQDRRYIPLEDHQPPLDARLGVRWKKKRAPVEILSERVEWSRGTEAQESQLGATLSLIPLRCNRLWHQKRTSSLRSRPVRSSTDCRFFL
jgi:hypothetical protein